MKQIIENLIADFKKANKARKLKIATKAGYSTPEEYLSALEAQVSSNLQQATPTVVATTPTTPIEKPTVHNVHILDASGSMQGDKFNNAIIGINTEIEQLKKDNTVDYTQTIVSFSDAYDIIWHNKLQPISKVHPFASHTRGMTAMFDAIGEVITLILGIKKDTDKVLVKIFTDGQENASKKYTSARIKNLIQEVESKGFTVTFVGTKQDVKYATSALKIDDSNTLVHDNTARGVAAAYGASVASTMSYSKKLIAGEDVTKGFFKKKGTL